jgi:hypothetical protein
MVLGSRRTLPAWSGGRFRSEFHGVFSEFHSVLGALAYGEAHGAAGVRVDFASPLFTDPQRGPNWWTYLFERSVMPLTPMADSAPELRLDGILSKYGRYGGFSDVVQGSTPYLYPMTCGLTRTELGQLIARHIQVRDGIVREVDDLVAARFRPGGFVVGVHYRGTDSIHSWGGVLTHYRTTRLPYALFADEVRRVVRASGAGAFQVFVATDEIDFVDFMQQEFGDRAIQVDAAPRARAGGAAVHLDRTLPVANYTKARSAIVDCLLLARTHYLVKGRSNLSDASLAFNPALPYSFCPDTTARS